MDGEVQTVYTERVKTLVTWLPIALVVGLALAFFFRPRATELVGETEFQRPEAPNFQPVVVPFGSATLRGRVVDEHGAPMVELPIYARSGDIAHWAYTDRDGRFQLDRLFDEELEVLALAFGRPTQSFRVRPGADEVALQVGPAREPAPRLPDLARSDLSGSLARALEGPTAGFQVLLEPLEPPNVFQGAIPVRAGVDAEGTFRFPGLAHGRYRIRVLPEWARGGNWPDLAAPDVNLLEHDGTRPARFVELGDGALLGRVEHEDGSPLSGALVLVHPAGDEAHPFPAAASDAEGAFRIAELPAGRYAVEVRAGEDVEELPEVEVKRGVVSTLPIARLVVRNPAASTESKP
ncbi:MAG: carboxypeptidase regulatory-like domain-containing protein [Planctomycetes bacterium]|nr:carboxypeptidase regulatory-like domain-containing protein [Planctomycetota bacterium]